MVTKKNEIEKPVVENTEEFPAVENTQEAQPEAIENLPPPMSKLRSFAQTKYPDKNFESDDEIAELLISSNSDLESKYNKAQEVTQKLVEIFQSYPDVRGFIGDLIMGAKPRAAWAKYWSKEDLEPQEGDDDMEEWKKNVAERESNLASQKKFEEDLASNNKFSEEQWSQFMEEVKLNEKDAYDFKGWLNGLFNDIFTGRITKEALMFLKKGWRADDDIAEAERLGELKGMNAKLTPKKDLVKKGDGLPNMQSSGEARPKPERPKSSIGRIADDINSRTLLK